MTNRPFFFPFPLIHKRVCLVSDESHQAWRSPDKLVYSELPEYYSGQIKHHRQVIKSFTVISLGDKYWRTMGWRCVYRMIRDEGNHKSRIKVVVSTCHLERCVEIRSHDLVPCTGLLLMRGRWQMAKMRACEKLRAWKPGGESKRERKRRASCSGGGWIDAYSYCIGSTVEDRCKNGGNPVQSVVD